MPFTTILLRLHGILHSDLTIFVKKALYLVNAFKIEILKRSKRHIIYSWIVLICFVAGQTMVFAHTHLVISSTYNTHKTAQNQQTITEKCQLCDAMHHNSMLTSELHYFSPVVVTDHFYKQGKYDFIGIALILSAGRSPPLS